MGLEREMESYRRILAELVRQVESREAERQEIMRNHSSRSRTPSIDGKIQRLENHIHSLSQATKDDSEAHDKLLDFMQRTTNVVEHHSHSNKKGSLRIGKFALPALLVSRSSPALLTNS